MDMIEKVLGELGLSENEIKIYRAAVRHEETSPYALSRETNIPRTTVYEAIMNLALKGLVTLVKSDGFTKQQTRIVAKNPSTLREIIRNSRERLTRLEVDVVQILPDLKAEYLKTVPNAQVRFFSGIEGAGEVYGRVYSGRLGVSVVGWDSMMPMDSFGSKKINKWVDQDLDARKSEKSIVLLNDWTKHVIGYQYGRDKRYLDKEFRYIDDSGCVFNQDIYVIGGSVFVVNGFKDEAWGMVINSELFAQTMKSMFEVMWRVARPITEEMVKSWGENEYLNEERRRK